MNEHPLPYTMTKIVELIRIVLRQRKSATSILLLASIVIGTSCTTSLKTSTLEALDTETTAIEADVEAVAQSQIFNSAEESLGKVVSIRGEVREIVEETSFLLEDERVFGGEDVLIINNGEPIVLLDGNESDLQIIGIVQKLVLADFEREYGIKLDPALYAKYENRPIVIARSIVLAPGPGDLTRNPEQYFGQRIAVSGEVDDVLSSMVFALDEEQLFGGKDLLVISQMMTTRVEEDEEVVVTGVLRPYVKAEFERDYTLDWDTSVQAEVEAEYAGEPVFVADDLRRPAP